MPGHAAARVHSAGTDGAPLGRETVGTEVAKSLGICFAVVFGWGLRYVVQQVHLSG